MYLKKYKILIFAIGSSGDIFPMIALAENLQLQGMEPYLVTVEHFRKVSEEKGIPFISIADEKEYLDAAKHPDIFHPLKGFSVVARTGIIPSIRRMFEIASKFTPDETLLIASGLCFGARIARDALKIPLVGVHLQPVVFRSLYDMPRLSFSAPSTKSPRILKKLFYWISDSLVIDPILKSEINSLRKENGLTPMNKIFKNYYHSPDLNLAFFPEWYAPKQLDWPEKTEIVGFPLYDNFKSEIGSSEEGIENFDKKPILFTAGTGNYHAKSFFEVALEACKSQKWNAVFLSKIKENIPSNLPHHIISKTFLPLSQILPHFSMLVHHGGIGTLSQAMAHSIPQLIVPFSHDQPDNAIRIHRLRVGDYILPGEFNHETLIKKINALLGSHEIQRNCLEYSIKLKLSDNGVKVASQKILDFLAHYTS